ncbi:MAG: helix-turn-helix domain-containing protein [Planctomycetota bacterium]
MRPREASKALGISERMLWEWTKTGVLPCIRRGKIILYSVDSLREWLVKETQLSIASGEAKKKLKKT